MRVISQISVKRMVSSSVEWLWFRKLSLQTALEVIAPTTIDDIKMIFIVVAFSPTSAAVFNTQLHSYDEKITYYCISKAKWFDYFKKLMFSGDYCTQLTWLFFDTTFEVGIIRTFDIECFFVQTILFANTIVLFASFISLWKWDFINLNQFIRNIFMALFCQRYSLHLYSTIPSPAEVNLAKIMTRMLNIAPNWDFISL